MKYKKKRTRSTTECCQLICAGEVSTCARSMPNMVTKQGGWARIRASVSPDADEGDKVKDKEEKRHKEDVKMRRCEDAKIFFSFLA